MAAIVAEAEEGEVAAIVAVAIEAAAVAAAVGVAVVVGVAAVVDGTGGKLHWNSCYSACTSVLLLFGCSFVENRVVGCRWRYDIYYQNLERGDSTRL